ncbi:hematopoietic SH2 domain-containing protein homolog isoform X2 [Melanotaenia boesemani]|nr:hematopoietic SH2 domain-containing protein homolog isoform X2 [Melanotaenia boesemani]XP_041863226.1 hematopoietic SH2 domain-containing protein homolog isoform X2 [Melanotaenia boesemani]
MEWNQPVQGQHNAFIWFTKSQLQSVIRNGVVPEWFHGIIPRKTAEELLMPKPPGYFLIRVSESRIGYTLSCRDVDRCRHFMIDALEDGQYIVVGESRRHRFLQDLVDFHRRTPIIPFTQVLTVACGQLSNDKSDYAELLFPSRHPASDNDFLQNSSPPPSTSQPVSEDSPPALPYRPNNLMDPKVLSPNSQPNRVYPCLEEEFGHVSSPLSAMAVPQARKKNAVINSPSNQPPEVPSRRCVPQQNQACIRTASAPESPHRSRISEQSLSTTIQPVKNQEGKASVATNLKNFKKKFQKKTNTSQENTYSEINLEASDRSGDTENEYQEIREEQIFSAPPNYNDNKATDQVLPYEYLPPPPFAPGY